VKRLFLVGVFSIATIVGLDVALQRVATLPPPLLEVPDGVAALEDGSPEVLVIGSSHTRSFVPIRDALAAQNPPQKMVLVPVEAGSFMAYDWVFEHRLFPILDKKKSLRRVILVTTFYDLCRKTDLANLPGRAWTFGDFLRDVGENGITDFNRNYLQRRFNRFFLHSILVQTHGTDRILDDIKATARTAEIRAEKRASGLQRWQRLIEEYDQTLEDPPQVAAFERIVGELRRRGYEIDIISFPLLPSSLTEKAKASVIARYAAFIGKMRGQAGIRVVDLTYGAPLGDDDFMADFDHVTLPGNQKFAAWALGGELAFLKALP
jgi:hypothetical protein